MLLHISQALRSFFQKFASENVLAINDILKNWDSIAPKHLVNLSVPFTIDHISKVLYIATTDPFIASELYIYAPQILQNIKKEIKVNIRRIKVISDIEKFNKYRELQESLKKSINYVSVEEIYQNLPQEDREKIEEIIKKVNDTKLQNMLKKFFTLSRWNELQNSKQSF